MKLGQTIIMGSIEEGAKWWSAAHFIKIELYNLYNQNNSFMQTWKFLTADVKVHAIMRNGEPWAFIYVGAGDAFIAYPDIESPIDYFIHDKGVFTPERYSDFTAGDDYWISDKTKGPRVAISWNGNSIYIGGIVCSTFLPITTTVKSCAYNHDLKQLVVVAKSNTSITTIYLGVPHSPTDTTFSIEPIFQKVVPVAFPFIEPKGFLADARTLVVLSLLSAGAAQRLYYYEYNTDYTSENVVLIWSGGSNQENWTYSTSGSGSLSITDYTLTTLFKPGFLQNIFIRNNRVVFTVYEVLSATSTRHQERLGIIFLQSHTIDNVFSKSLSYSVNEIIDYVPTTIATIPGSMSMVDSSVLLPDTYDLSRQVNVQYTDVLYYNAEKNIMVVNEVTVSRSLEFTGPNDFESTADVVPIAASTYISTLKIGLEGVFTAVDSNVVLSADNDFGLNVIGNDVIPDPYFGLALPLYSSVRDPSHVIVDFTDGSGTHGQFQDPTTPFLASKFQYSADDTLLIFCYSLTNVKGAQVKGTVILDTLAVDDAGEPTLSYVSFPYRFDEGELISTNPDQYVSLPLTVTSTKYRL